MPLTRKIKRGLVTMLKSGNGGPCRNMAIFIGRKQKPAWEAGYNNGPKAPGRPHHFPRFFLRRDCMGKNDGEKPWYIIWCIIAFTIVLAFLGFCISIPECWKSYSRAGGVIISSFGFLLMLFSGYLETNERGERRRWINLHKIKNHFWVGLVFVCLGFVSQILGR